MHYLNWYAVARSLLFRVDAERAHHWVLESLNYLPQFVFKSTHGSSVEAMGLKFPHQVGLAAGLDKNGEYLDGLARIGFSFIELGTVTPKPQAGNPKPRLFRLPQAHAIINRMGFNNRGVDYLMDQVNKSSYKGILGINIGKNKDTPLDKAAEDYLYCLRAVYQKASYVTINISSPNTEGLRQLQQGAFFGDLLSQLHEEQMKLSDQFQCHVPLVIKISPDESDETLKQMTELILKNGIEGIIATNTTISRERVQGIVHGNEEGGLSGRPLFQSSTLCLSLLKHYVGNAVTLIGVGGIDNVQRAQDKLDAGASLVQVYTGLIFKGPGLVNEIASGLITSANNT